MIELLAYGLGAYLVIGSAFALSVLIAVNRRLSEADRRPRYIYWLTNIILFCRWSCNWLWLAIYMSRKNGK